MLAQASVLALTLLPFSFAQISDSFEDGWDQSKWPIYAPDCNQGGTVTLDSSTAHTGKNSLKVTSPGGYCGHIFFGNNNSIPAGDVYVRTWLKAANALTPNHVSYITMTDASLAAGKHLRIGGQDQIIMYNRETDDATLPDLSPQGIATSEALPAGSWQCFEYHVKNDGTIETWLNGAAIPGLAVGPGISNPNANGWGASYKPSITGVYFGWESYGGDVNTFWWDDIAISSTRNGCGSSASAPTSTPLTTTSVPKTTTGAATSTKTTAGSTTLTTTTATTTSSATPTSGVPTVPEYGQCGGIGWIGGTVCAAGYTCQKSNDYYSQCL